MKQIVSIVFAFCLFSCQKREDAPPPVLADPKDSVIVVEPFPRTVNYKGTLKVDEMQAAVNPADDYYFDTVYQQTLNVQYHDSASVTLHLNWWGINSLGGRIYHQDSGRFEINTSGEYFIRNGDYINFILKGDSLNCYRQQGGTSHNFHVYFAGIRVR
jgi:hypothetical protein